MIQAFFSFHSFSFVLLLCVGFSKFLSSNSWTLVLLGLFWCWCPSIDLFYNSFDSLNSSLPEFLFGSFFLMISIALLNFSLCSYTVFLMLLSYLSVFSGSSLSFLKTTILKSLLSKFYLSVSLDAITGRWQWSFHDVMFLWLSMFLGVSCCCPCIWYNRHLLQNNQQPSG